jgi:galacturan 1,4-alpha-galacturonidase
MVIAGSLMRAVLVLCLGLVSCEAKNSVLAIGRGGRGGGGTVVGDVAGHDETVFNVLQYGAVANGRKDNTQAFMKAWVAACHWKGKARLVVPKGDFLLGQVIFGGPCNGPTPIVVQIMGTLKAVTDLSEYSSAEWVTFESINGLVVMGGGTFDGQGAEVWKYNDCHSNNNCQLLASNIKFNHVTNGVFKRISSINPKSFHIVLFGCTDFRAHRLHIFAPKDSPNTDGIHVSDSTRVKISKSVIGTGDDCISIGQGSTNIGVNRVTCGPGHGISVGSLGKYPDEKDVGGIIVKNSTFLNTDNGVRIKTWPDKYPSQAKGFLFQDIIMTNVKNPIIIDQQYCASSNPCSGASQVKISNVHYKNIRGTTTTPVAVNFMCSKQFPCQNVELFNINLKFVGNMQKGLPASSACVNAKVGFRGVQIPPPCR